MFESSIFDLYCLCFFRLLVAGYVGTNPSGDKMKIGHTTFMPNIHGLSALMCLIFSPTVELRSVSFHSIIKLVISCSFSQ